jgi:hypothetical protein
MNKLLEGRSVRYYESDQLHVADFFFQNTAADYNLCPLSTDTRNVEALLLKGNVLLDLKKLADAMNHFRHTI